MIDICTPNVCHRDTILKAIRAGKHILCEKPLASTAEEAREILAAAKRHEESGKVCGVVFNNRNHAAILRAKELIASGALGEILSFRADYLHNSCLDPNKNAGWKQDATVCGKGGVLYDLGSHVLDLVYYLCGPYRSISSRSQIAFPERKGMNGDAWTTDASEAFYMLAELQNGAVGTVTASKLTCGANDDLNVEVFGTKGSLRFSLMNPNYLYFYDGTQPSLPYGGTAGYTAIECVGRYSAPGGVFPSVKAANGWLRGHIHGMYRYLDAVAKMEATEKGTSAAGVFAPSIADAAYIQTVMEAAMESAESGARVAVDEV
ncbi:MAG: Gfo/Idh/MocA family oxidoreductase [Clostridia bacterium]|nr:Gfo/Idh/MocA family oxidoreductase [Clostridia bacterium]